LLLNDTIFDLKFNQINVYLFSTARLTAFE